MRIIGGEKGGRPIAGPGPKEVRPMRHAVRKALFDILRSEVAGSNFLDLFAGTGSVGLEALSRGAAWATFVERMPEALRLIRKNLKELDMEDRAHVYAGEVEDFLRRSSAKDRTFQLVFLGPPYGKGLTSSTLKTLVDSPSLDEEAIVAAEVFKKNDLPHSFGRLKMVERRDYGQNRLVFYRFFRL